ncbi:T9SS type A sorting domain-containing protein [Luteibaculum oceani]|uniref:T9SS type A sorting domain-containing protein n=1 Tax=Luteibaculum oceani TaxID=1294296 RepID=A0A5C6V255_9FLAO|nr:T9SS type A sorting domain-containing protein [Luteibaculum oceani]TXC78516.1 T9SS type A sorting domain-containing protein [Luteibaculum oceani]
MKNLTLWASTALFAFVASTSISAQEISAQNLKENFKKLNRKGLIKNGNKSPRKASRLALDSMYFNEVELGQVTYSDIVTYEYDLTHKEVSKSAGYSEELGSREYYGFYENTFDVNGNIVHYKDFDFDNGVLSLGNEEIYTFENNLLIKTESNTYWETDTNSSRTFHFYVEGKNALDSVFTLYGDGKWYFTSKWTYEYSLSGKMTKANYFDDSNNGANPNYYDGYIYDGNDWLIEENNHHHDNSNPGNYTENWKTVYTRNVKGNILTSSDYYEGALEFIFEAEYSNNDFINGINLYNVDSTGKATKYGRYDFIDAMEMPYEQLLVDEWDYLPMDFNPGRINHIDFLMIDSLGLENKVGELRFYWSSKTVGISEIPTIDFTISPNPSSDFISVNLENNSTMDYTITDVAGRILKSGRIPAGYQIDIQRLKTGTYHLNVAVSNGKGSTTFIKQ